MAEADEITILMDENAEIVRYVRMPESLDGRLKKYCRTHNLMKVIREHGQKHVIPNLSAGIRQILETALPA